ncbi:Helicase C-terminal domain-containing protein [Fusarium keratoplasticum]|uniref:Helicase C-terminal domain-containing protein n=1 Tax=Fusarium keratoplasticum TaxID=1328300 RepID=A0ACC0RBZ4_9HYPO|nr:Helicase C-terminal domain-containing protein [Fusarium keratoplasticum]KAI8680041.1 Helicase C-terminal domain-containing protein [Fusarium keratoplasticum]
MIVKKKPKEDILLFLTTTQEIEEACAMIRRRVPSLLVLPLYSALPSEAQRLAMSKSHFQQCIVLTNVAEASVTIPGVVYVIDVGKEKKAGDEVADKILQLKDLGVDEVARFDFIDPPMPEAYPSGLQELRAATAIIVKPYDLTSEEKGTAMDLLRAWARRSFGGDMRPSLTVTVQMYQDFWQAVFQG